MVSIPYQEGRPLRNPDSQQVDALKIIIIGGGIGGLTAALALRQQGHKIEVYESSGFSKEVGAALHTGPNGNGVLKRLGISCKEIGANVAEWVSEWTPGGVRVKQTNITGLAKLYEHKWRCAHRIRLHDTLRKAVTGDDGSGPPATLQLSKSVVDINTANAIAYFKDGSSVQGDVIIGADGVHSVTRTKLPEGNMQPFPSGLSAFRFLVSRDTVLANAQTRKFAEDDGNLNGIFAKDRSIVMYPTSNNTLLNFVCIHPDSESVSTDGWGSSAARSKLFEVYKDFHPDIIALLEMAEEGSLKVWKLLDMAPLPNWCHERLAVIGDAAHPFMPFLGQGAAIAIEDAVAMAVVLEAGLKKEEVPERLKLYQKIRKERAELVQHYTRLSGRNRGESTSFDVAKYQGYCFGWNEWDHSAQMLREWKWARLPKSSRVMKTVFGPGDGLDSVDRSVVTPRLGPGFTTASIRFSTSRTVLDGLLPPGNKSYRFKSPASIAQCTFRQTSYTGSPETGERGYTQLGLYIHNVEYQEADERTVSGAFLPIMFEDGADIITSGREDLGIPKVLSTINIERDRRSFHVRTSSNGLTWGNFCLDDLELVEPIINGVTDTELAKTNPPIDEGLLYHQYVSQTDKEQQSERTVFVPTISNTTTDTSNGYHDTSKTGTSTDHDTVTAETVAYRTWKAKSAHFKLNARDQDALPALHHIISRLQEIPVHEIVEAKVVEGPGVPQLA